MDNYGRRILGENEQQQKVDLLFPQLTLTSLEFQAHLA